MEMAPGTIGAGELDVREPPGRLIADYPALPGHRDAEPPDGIVELGAFEHCCLRIPVLHHEAQPVRRDVEEVPRVLEEAESLSARQGKYLRCQKPMGGEVEALEAEGEGLGKSE